MFADPERIGEPYLGRYLVWESSGSSGQPTIFVQDAHSAAIARQGVALQRGKSGKVPWVIAV